MRLFISIPLPENVISHLRSIQESFSSFSMKCSFPDSFHLTLKFLGSVDDKYLDKIKASLKSIKLSKFKLNLGKFGFFPDENYVRVVWIGVSPDKEIFELHNLIDESVRSLFKVELDFVPH